VFSYIFIYGHLCKLSVGFVTDIMGFIAEYVSISYKSKVIVGQSDAQWLSILHL
jgi:hypothetical protein